jgi:hypothetical protein
VRLNCHAHRYEWLLDVKWHNLRVLLALLYHGLSLFHAGYYSARRYDTDYIYSVINSYVYNATCSLEYKQGRLLQPPSLIFSVTNRPTAKFGRGRYPLLANRPLLALCIFVILSSLNTHRDSTEVEILRLNKVKGN